MQTYLTLKDENKIPQFGLGVYQIQGNENTKAACKAALDAGCRHIDTAHAYQNEAGVGEAIKKSGIPRNEIWVTDKLWISDYADGKAADSIDHIRMNMDIFDFELTEDEMRQIRSMDKNERFYTFANLPIEEQDAQMSQWTLPD